MHVFREKITSSLYIGMSQIPRVNLIDPILYQSNYVNRQPKINIGQHFWNKFDPINFLLNLVLPLSIIIFILFVLKEKYLSKKKGNLRRAKRVFQLV